MELTTQERKQSRWRGHNYERRVARLIKGVVVGRSKAVKVSDKFVQVNCQRPPDVVNAWLSVECKHWKSLPVWLDKVMGQAIHNAPQGLTPIAWVGDREAKANYVIMHERDFLDNFVGKNG